VMFVKKLFSSVYTFWVLLAEGVGGLSGWLSRDGMKRYMATAVKPPLTPPGPLFPIVWTILYLLMGIGAARVYRTPASNARSKGLGVFLLQLGVNFFWSIIFFSLEAYGFALLWLLLLWGLVLWMIVLFCRVDKTAGLMQIPYLLWLSFAAYLNYGVWMLNR